MSERLCGPFICDMPDPKLYRWRDRWRCPKCGTVYVLGRKVRHYRWYRNWIAPDGSWVLPMTWRIR